MHSINFLDEIYDVPDDENDLRAPVEKTELDLFSADETRIDNNMNILSYWNLNEILKEIYPPAVEHCTKRQSSFISTDSIPSTTLNKKIKLMTETQEVDEATTDEDNDDEQL
ncbi:unnamed protein product [Rotaria sordida]|uniref:Uncharacterized protein n=1 Tax=Rotaria sordida TaxID=392033 RepID=A0A815DR06_9BILA|nr:unnamed protein product [Rotaria sordida]CAF4159867.1 unnamed protein product [Rotaria sordida]